MFWWCCVAVVVVAVLMAAVVCALGVLCWCWCVCVCVCVCARARIVCSDCVGDHCTLWSAIGFGVRVGRDHELLFESVRNVIDIILSE